MYPRRGAAIRISELAQEADVPVATIKYYLREGLLPAGRQTAPNQASYDASHVERLRLIRVLREIGGLGIDAIGQLVETIDDPRRSLHEVLGAAHRAISPPRATPAGAGPAEHAEIDDLLRQLGWTVSHDAPDRGELAEALAGLRAVGVEVTAEAFVPYARAVEPIAEHELSGLPAHDSRDEAVRYVVVGTVVFGAAMTALRRLAQEHYSARLQDRRR